MTPKRGARARPSPYPHFMIDKLRAELVIASFDDPLVTALQVEQAAELAARLGAVADRPRAEPGTVFVVTRERRGPVGCAGLRGVGDHDAEIGPIYIRPEYRGLGVTRLLLRAVEDLARRRGCRTTRSRAADLGDVGLYESSGYVRVPPFGSHPARSICFEKTLGAEAGR